MANNQYINRVDVVRGNSTDTLINISDTTAVASDVASGKYFYLASGEKVAGTSSGGGGGSVTQDSNGFIVLPETGGGGGSTGLVYETGTWTPSEDIVGEWISFSDSHSEEPIYVLIEDSDISTTPSECWTVCSISLWSNFYGATGNYRGIAAKRYLTGTTHGGSTTLINSDFSLGNYVTSSSFRPNGSDTGYYWKAGRTYKWVAVWAPTS